MLKLFFFHFPCYLQFLHTLLGPVSQCLSDAHARDCQLHGRSSEVRNRHNIAL